MQDIESPIESQIKEDFNGAGGETLYRLTNGQVWKQSRYLYQYHYAYRPQVCIVHEGNEYVMHVQGMSNGIPVRKIR
jgi:hypothetical protein